MGSYLVFDIGGTFIKFAIVKENQITIKGKVKTPRESLEQLLEVIQRIYSPYADEVVGVAISMPGIIDTNTGYAVHGGSLRYIRHLNIAEMIQNQLKVPVCVENDGKSAALGELWKGRLQQVNNGVVMVIGTGIGGGIIIDGKLVKGHHLGAGEFSFIRTNSQHAEDFKYMFGVLGSNVALTKKVAAEVECSHDKVDGETLFQWLAEEQPKVCSVFQEYCREVAIQIINIQSILDPEKFVIGGGMSANPLLVIGIRKALTEQYALSSFDAVHATVERSELGNDANLYGALYQYLQKEKDWLLNTQSAI